MFKKMIITMSVPCLLICAGFMVNFTVERIVEKKVVANKIALLPKLNLTFLEGSNFVYLNNGKTVLVLFESDCDHCQNEAENISKKISEIKAGSIVFLSSEETDKLTSFSKNYNLSGSPFIHVAHIDYNQMIDNFGSISFPHIFIYDDNQRLIKQFKGETKADAILKYLK